MPIAPLRRPLQRLTILCAAFATVFSLLTPAATAASSDDDLRPGERPTSDISPAPPDPKPAAPGAGAKAQAADVPDVPPLKRENGSVDVDSGPSLAADPLDAQPVGPGRLTPDIPAGDALTDRVSADALDRLDRVGLTSDGKPDPRTTKLLPSTADAPLLDVSTAGDEQLAEVGDQIEKWSGVDPVELLKELPRGIPLVTYRLCAQSETRKTACSLARPLIVPAVADVTGDGTPDLLADALPAVEVDAVLDLSRTAGTLQQRIESAEKRLAKLLELLKDPLYAILHPEALLEVADLRGLLKELRQTLTETLHSLGLKIGAGIGLLSLRLPGGDTAGKPLKAQVWAEYDLPAAADLSKSKRLSMGFDGYRRGSGLSALDWGVFTADVGAALDGRVDVRGRLHHLSPADSLGTVLGLADVGRDKDKVTDPTVVNALQTPVPGSFDVRAKIDPAARETTVTTESSRATRLDALAVTNRDTADPPEDRATQVIVDKLPTTLTASLTRPEKDGQARVDFSSSAAIDKAAFHDHVYRGTTLHKTISAEATALPTRLALTADAGEGTGEQQGKASLSVTANAAAAKTLTGQYFDRAAQRTIVEGKLTDLPASLTATVDTAGHRMTIDPATPIGSIEALYQRAGGAIASPDGDHGTYISTDGAARGASLRLNGLAGFDLTYGAHPHGVLRFTPGGQSFLGWAAVGSKLARISVSNLPARTEVDVDPAARTAAYRASEKIDTLRAAYVDTDSGPTLDATAKDVPARLDTSFRLGDKPQVKLVASSEVTEVKGYYSPDPVTRIDPKKGHDVYAVVKGVPAEVTADVDLAAKHLQWQASDSVDSVHVVARAKFSGGDWTVAGKVTGVPARFDADFGDDLYRFRGQSGPLGSAWIAATNHPGATAPSGSHLAVHHNAARGDTDASVRVSGLSEVRYGRTADGMTSHFAADGDKVAVDADVTRTDDTRVALRGYVGPLPNDIEVTSDGGTYTYKASNTLDVQAQFWAGKVAALRGLGAPRLDNGISAVNRGCKAGEAGCASDDGPFCAEGKGCFGITGIVDVTGLPTSVTANTAEQTFSFTGYDPQSDVLQLYFHDTVWSKNPLKALIKATSLPGEVQDLKIGPMTLGEEFDLKYTSSVKSAGILDVHAEAADVPKLGDSRFMAHLDPIPGSLHVHGKVGADTDLMVDNSTALNQLDVRATGTFDGDPASGRLDLKQVPASTNWSSAGFGEKGLGMPTVAYEAKDADGNQGADADTLDGSVMVEAKMVKETSDVTVGADDLQLHLTDLGHSTKIEVDKDNYRAEITSTPKTGQIKVIGNLQLTVPRQDIDKTFFDCKVVTGRFYGHLEIKPSVIDDITISVDDVSKLRMQPGLARTDTTLPIPQVVGYLYQAFDGTYDKANISFSGVKLDPDIDLYFRIDKLVGPDFFQEHIEITDPTDTLMFHRYDHEHESEFSFYLHPGNFKVWSFKARPGIAQAPQENSMTIPGGTPQMISFLDPADKVNDTILAFLSYHVWPYDGEHKPEEEQSSSFC